MVHDLTLAYHYRVKHHGSGLIECLILLFDHDSRTNVIGGH
jgi:hypothetical protein